MPGEVKLKPCPFCGKQPLHTVLRPRASTEIHRYECDCGFSRTAFTNSEEKAAMFWNHRSPEPGTSVIRWARYDGTPETLPDLDRMILVHWINEMQIRTVSSGIHKLFDVGDLWSYLPEPPEGME